MDAGTVGVKQPASLLVGQMVEPVVLAPKGHTGVAAIRLRPAAARTLLGFSLHEVLGRFVDLELIFPSVAVLCERLARRGATMSERVGALELWLVEMACSPPWPAASTTRRT